MISPVASLMPSSTLTCLSNYVGVLRQVPYDQMEGSPFSSAHVDRDLAREVERMHIIIMTPKLLAACYFVDRITWCEGSLYNALGVDEPSRNQLLSGALRVRNHFDRPRYGWMEEDPVIAGALILELAELQRLRLEAYKTVMDWKSDVQQVAPDLEDFVHPRDLDGLLPALNGLQTFFLGLLVRANTVDLARSAVADSFFFPTGRPDSGTLTVLPDGGIGTLPPPAVERDDPTDPTDAYYVTPTMPQVMNLPLDDSTPTAPLPLVVAKQDQLRSMTPPIPLVREVRRG